MSLDVVNGAKILDANLLRVLTRESYSKWQDFPISSISHHGEPCCETARDWLLAMDYSQTNASSALSGPRWISERYSWGPTRWPTHWCNIFEKKTLDCGAQSALAREIFRARGAQAYQVQLVQRYSIDATRQWAIKWDDAQASTFWLNNDLIYHECCAVVTAPGMIKIWDGSAGSWVNSRQFGGYGSVVALRIVTGLTAIQTYKWGENSVTINRWEKI